MKKLYTLFAALAIVFCGVAFTAYADPLYFGANTSTATATSTIAFMTPGTGTTTLTYDAFQYNSTNGRFGSGRTSVNDAILAFQYTGSSSVATTALNVRLEYSDDNVDWYPLSLETTTTATDTPMTRYQEFQFIMDDAHEATDGVLGTSVGTRQHQALKVDDMPTRYVRAVFYVPAGSVNGSLWAEWVPRKEIN